MEAWTPPFVMFGEDEIFVLWLGDEAAEAGKDIKDADMSCFFSADTGERFYGAARRTNPGPHVNWHRFDIYFIRVCVKLCWYQTQYF